VKETEGKTVRIDYLGSILSIIGLVAIIYGFTEENWFISLLGIVILAVFLMWEKHITYPILPLSLFQNRTRTGAYMVRLLFMMAMLPFWFFLPQMMQTSYGFSALASGMAFLPLTLVNFGIALQLPRFVQKYGNKRVLVTGELILALGLTMMAVSDIEKGYWVAIFLPMLILGLVQGLILAPVTSAGVHEASDDLAGVASGLTNTMHQIGGPIGLSIIVAFTSSFNGALWFMLAFTIMGGLIATFVIESDRKSSYSRLTFYTIMTRISMTHFATEKFFMEGFKMTKHEALKNGVIFPIGEKNETYAQFFIGQSYLQSLVTDSDINVGVANVTFEPGCRNNWHIHHDGYQILLVTGGEGWYQEEGKDAQFLQAGDIIVTHDGVKHWHGATQNSWFEHIAITAGTPEWLEPVNDQWYVALHV